MALKTIGTIAIPDAVGSEFDHAAFDANSRRVFIAHTARDCLEVIDHDAGKVYSNVRVSNQDGAVCLVATHVLKLIEAVTS